VPALEDRPALFEVPADPGRALPRVRTQGCVADRPELIQRAVQDRKEDRAAT
jgi:hypothetical protein